MQRWEGFTRMIFNIIKFQILSLAATNLPKQSPVIPEINDLRFCFETEVPDDTCAAWGAAAFCLAPIWPRPRHVRGLPSSLSICMAQKSAFPETIPHGQLLSSFQNSLCGLTL